MQTEIQERMQYTPARLLTGFTKTRIVVWIAVAVALHALLIGMTSLGYIRDKLAPEQAAARKAAAAAAAAEKTRPPKAAAKVPAAPGPTNVAAVAKAAPAGEEAIPEERKNAPVVKRITEAAKGAELPKQPGDLGISVDDTNPR